VAKPTPKPNNEIKTVHLAPRVIGVTFEPPKPEPVKEPAELLPFQKKVVTRFINGMLQNVTVDIPF